MIRLKTTAALLLLLTLILPGNASALKSPANTCFSLGRAIEIRYIKVELKADQEFPKEITVEEKTYPLFKTREEAINYVKTSAVRRDLTTVYVASEEIKKKEVLDIVE